MKIYLFYSDMIYSYILPKELEGSYSFDVDKNESSKLINVEVRDGKWVIYSIEGVNLIHNNTYIESLPLLDDSFYVINRNNKNYLVYTADVGAEKFNLFSYDSLSMVVGNANNCNVKYNCPFLGNDYVTFTKQNDSVILQTTKFGFTYVNDKAIKENSYIVKNGDTISIFGLKIMFLNNMILMNNPGGKVQIPNYNFGLNLYNMPASEDGKNIPIIDRNLYNKQDYFSKAPRIRRLIETKTIKLSPPPTKDTGNELPLILTIGPMATMGIMSCVTIINLAVQLSSGTTTIEKSWPQLITSGAMLLSMLLWPIIMNVYNRKMKERDRKELIEKYDAYLAEKEKEVIEESHLQKDILNENLITVTECLNIIAKKKHWFLG